MSDLTTTERAFLAALEAATTATTDADTLVAVARALDPDADPPTPEALAEWWPEGPEAARTEADTRSRALYGPEAGDGWPPDSMETPARIDRPREVTPFDVRDRASLPGFERGGNVGRLPDLPGDDPPPQLDLPGFEAVPNGMPHWLLRLYEDAGGPIAQGKRLPIGLTLAVGALVRLPVSVRDGHWRTLRFPHRIEHEADWPEDGIEAAERWLWPDGWSNRHRDRRKIADGLRDAKPPLRPGFPDRFQCHAPTLFLAHHAIALATQTLPRLSQNEGESGEGAAVRPSSASRRSHLAPGRRTFPAKNIPPGGPPTERRNPQMTDTHAGISEPAVGRPPAREKRGPRIAHDRRSRRHPPPAGEQ